MAAVTLQFASKNVHKTLTSKLKRMERRNWHACPEKEAYRALVAELRNRAGTTLLTQGVDAEARERADWVWHNAQNRDNPEPDLLRLGELKTRGQSLASATQATLHQGIRERMTHKDRRETKDRLKTTTDAVRTMRGDPPTEGEIWTSIRHKDLSKGARGFLWKNMHNAYRLGSKWEDIPGMSSRGICSLCGGTESMEHILLECQESEPRKAVWALAEKLWCLREDEWPEVTLGTILGCNLAGFRANHGDERGKLDEGKNRLFTITISESAHLIWKMRCERVIRHGDDPARRHTPMEAENRWLLAINTRLKLDKLYTNRKVYGKRSMKRATVIKTWHGVLTDEQNLSYDWVRQSGGLVGIAARRRNGWNPQPTGVG